MRKPPHDEPGYAEKLERHRGDIIRAFDACFRGMVSPGYVKQKVMALLDWLDPPIEGLGTIGTVRSWDRALTDKQIAKLSKPRANRAHLRDKP